MKPVIILSLPTHPLREVAYATHPRPLVLAVGDFFADSLNIFTRGVLNRYGKTRMLRKNANFVVVFIHIVGFLTIFVAYLCFINSSIN